MSKLLPALMGDLDITLEHGSALPLFMTWTDNATPPVPIDLTGMVATMQVRTSKQDKGAALLELTSAGGDIILGGSAGTIVFTITAEKNVFGDAELFWELQITDSAGAPRPLVGGKAKSIRTVVK